MNRGKMQRFLDKSLKSALTGLRLVLSKVWALIKRTNPLKSITVAISILLLALLYSDFRKRAIVFDTIESCPNLQSIGLSNSTCANLLRFYVEKIYLESHSHDNGLTAVAPGFSIAPELQLPGTGISYEGFLRLSRRVLGVEEPHIHGSLSCTDTSLSLFLGISGLANNFERSTIRTFPRVTSPDSILQLAAIEVVKQTNPYILACFFFTNRHYDEALFILEKYCLSTDSRAERAWALSLSGATLGKLKRWEDAEFRFGEAIRVKPDLAATYSNWGIVLASEGKMREALDKYEQAERIDEGDPIYPFHMAATYFLDLADTLEAERLARRATTVDPSFAPAHSLMGDILHARGLHKEAAEEYHLSVEWSRGSGWFYNSWGSELLEIGDTNSAIFAYSQAYLLDSLTNFHPLNNLGQIAFARGRYLDAIKWFRLSIAAEKPSVFVYRNISYDADQTARDHLAPGYFQIGKANLLLGDTASAKSSFRWVALNRPGTELSRLSASILKALGGVN